jgi:hypothetical protein
MRQGICLGIISGEDFAGGKVVEALVYSVFGFTPFA